MTKYIELSGKAGIGKFILVDDEDYDKISSRSWEFDGVYAISSFWENSRKFSMRVHKYILVTPKGKFIDHINGNGLDNRKENLRICTHQENCRNKKTYKNNTSGYKGVDWSTQRCKWRTRVRCKSKNLYIGFFDSIIDAVKAYNEKSTELFGEFARINSIGNGDDYHE